HELLPALRTQRPREGLEVVPAQRTGRLVLAEELQEQFLRPLRRRGLRRLCNLVYALVHRGIGIRDIPAPAAERRHAESSATVRRHGLAALPNAQLYSIKLLAVLSRAAGTGRFQSGESFLRLRG